MSGVSPETKAYLEGGLDAAVKVAEERESNDRVRQIQTLLEAADHGEWFSAGAEATATTNDSYQMYCSLLHALVGVGFELGFPDHVWAHLVASKMGEIQVRARTQDEQDEYVAARDGLAEGGR